MSKLSIIVPVFNTEKYIERCLDSIANQTKKLDIEVVVINDGSTDNSEKVITTYIKEEKNNMNIKYYSKKNEGIAKTRNFGIEKATSEYIMFLDSDDYLKNSALEVLENHIEQKIDLIKFKLQRVDEKDNIIEKVEGPVFDKITGQEAFNKLFGKDVLIDSPCVYAIKKELFTENKFKFQRTYHEDFGLIPMIILVSKTVISIPEYLYQYVQVPNSITRTEDDKKIIKKMEDVLYHYDSMLTMIESFELEKTTKENVKIYYTNAVVLKIKELKKEDQGYYIKEIKKRNMYKNIKPRNIKQLIKRFLLKWNIKLYLRIH